MQSRVTSCGARPRAGLRGGGFKRLIRNQVSLRSLILALGRFALVDTGVTMGLPPQALPEGILPSDSPLRFAAVLRGIHNTASTKKRAEPAFTSAEVRHTSKSCSRGRFYAISYTSKKAPSLIERKRISFIFYSLINSYSRLPKPIFSAWSRQLRHSDSGVEFLNGSPQSAKPGFFKLSESWLFGIGFAVRQASTHA